MAKLYEYSVGYIFYCPACDVGHQFFKGHWSFDGDMEKPTFNPSLKNSWTEGEQHIPMVCHLFLRNGIIEFCGDCTHAMAGQKMPLPEIPEHYGLPTG